MDSNSMNTQFDVSSAFSDYISFPSTFEQKRRFLSPDLVEITRFNNSSKKEESSDNSPKLETPFMPPILVQQPNPVLQQAPALSRPKYKGKEIDIDRAIDIVHMNLGKQSKHTCTRAVANALQGETNYRKSSGISDPSHMYDRLRQDGWRDVLTSDYTPKKGDIYTVWGVGGRYGMHTSIYDGEKWLSYDVDNPKQGGKTPWFWDKINNPGVKAHIMRGKNGMKFQEGGDLIPRSEYSPNGMFVDYIGAPSTFREKENTLDNILKEFKVSNTIFSRTEDKKEDKKEESKKEESLEERLSKLDLTQATTSEQKAQSTPPVATATETIQEEQKREGGKELEPTRRRRGAYDNTEKGKRQFVHDLNQAYLRAGVKNEELRKMLVGQSALESGYGSASLGGGDYNYGNLTTGSKWKGNWRVARDKDGKGNWILQKFRSYDSMDDFVKDKLEFIGLNSRYKVDINKDTPQTYIDKIVRGGYAQDPNYRAALYDMYYNWINKRWS